MATQLACATEDGERREKIIQLLMRETKEPNTPDGESKFPLWALSSDEAVAGAPPLTTGEANLSAVGPMKLVPSPYANLPGGCGERGAATGLKLDLKLLEGRVLEAVVSPSAIDRSLSRA